METAIYEGDNGDVIAALREKLIGRVRCIYLDPPYNNQETYTYYSDRLSHKTWLEQIRAAFAPLFELLRDDGSIWISIDDTEMHYLKVAADEIFGRERFVTTVVWQHRRSRENRRVFSNNHEYLLVYAKEPSRFRHTRGLVSAGDDLRMRYKNPDDDPRGDWQSITATAQAGHGTPAQFYELVAPSGRRHVPPNGRCWVYSAARMAELIERGEIWFGREGCGVPRVKRYLADARLELTPETLWSHDFAGTTQDAKKHLLRLFPDETVFDTPKPEALMRRLLEIATNEGDLVLDPYAGSGTTLAASHKMHRCSIGIERNPAAARFAAARMDSVIAGEQGGISRAVSWTGGGAFSYEQFAIRDVAA